MDINEIRSNLVNWQSFATKTESNSRSKELFLKVHDGQLQYAKRAELPSGIRWLREKGDYNFQNNIQKLSALLHDANKHKDTLKPEERAQLEELQALHNKLVERFEKKNVPGFIGRILSALGLKNYSEAIQEAVNRQKVDLDWKPQIDPQRMAIRDEAQRVRSQCLPEILAFRKLEQSDRAAFNRDLDKMSRLSHQVDLLTTFAGKVENQSLSTEEIRQELDVILAKIREIIAEANHDAYVDEVAGIVGSDADSEPGAAAPVGNDEGDALDIIADQQKQAVALALINFVERAETLLKDGRISELQVNELQDQVEELNRLIDEKDEMAIDAQCKKIEKLLMELEKTK